MKSNNNNKNNNNNNDNKINNNAPPTARIKGTHWSNDLKVQNVTMNYFYEPHSLTALVLVLCIMIYGLYSHDSEASTSLHNARYSAKCTIIIFLILGTMVLPNGPFIRPHPHIWRIALGVAIVYEMFLVFILFLSTSDGRQYMTFLEDGLGVPLEEINYAEDCRFDLLHIWNSLDRFALAHFFGWVCKMLVIRSRLLCWILSISWEVVEILFTAWQPNFAECWWDQLLLDVIIANGAGIHIGYHLSKWLEFKQYKWHGIKNFPTIYGKAKRVVMQFTPERWTKMQWSQIHGWRKFVYAQIVVWGFLVQEFNAFLLKAIFWVPPKSPLNIYRLAIYFSMGLPALKQLYMYATDKECKRLGTHCWITIVILITEVFVILRHGSHIYTIKFPDGIGLLMMFSVIMYFSITSFVLLGRSSHSADNNTQVKKNR